MIPRADVANSTHHLKVVGSNLDHPILDENDVKVCPGSIPVTPNPGSYAAK